MYEKQMIAKVWKILRKIPMMKFILVKVQTHSLKTATLL